MGLSGTSVQDTVGLQALYNLHEEPIVTLLEYLVRAFGTSVGSCSDIVVALWNFRLVFMVAFRGLLGKWIW